MPLTAASPATRCCSLVACAGGGSVNALHGAAEQSRACPLAAANGMASPLRVIERS